MRSSVPKTEFLFSGIFITLGLFLSSGFTLSGSRAFFIYRSYQSSIYCNASFPIQKPEKTQDVVNIVKYAFANRMRVKAFGARHSITDIICTDGIPISMSRFKHKRLNRDGTAIFGAGIQLQEALEFLESREFSLEMVPTFSGITIGGAIGTGAHGSSLIHPASLSDQIVQLKVVAGNGSLIYVTNPSDLDAFRVHLGLLGVIVSVRLKTVPLFKMKVHNKREEQGILFNNQIPNMASKFDMFQFWWFSASREVIVGKGTYVSVNTPGNATSNFIPDALPSFQAASSVGIEALQSYRNTLGLDAVATFRAASLHMQLVGVPPVFTENGAHIKNPATGYAWRLQSNKCTEDGNGGSERCSWSGDRDTILPEENSMAFDISKFTGVMNMMREVIQEYPVSFPLVGIYVRFLKASTGLMSISSGRTTFTVEWATPMRRNPFQDAKDGISAYQLMLQRMVKEFGGRPHWGKNGLLYLRLGVIYNAYPQQNLVDFVKKRFAYDPTYIFMNKFGLRLFGIEDRADMDPRVTHCALQDYCLCIEDTDCGHAHVCETITHNGVKNRYHFCKTRNPPPKNPAPEDAMPILGNVLQMPIVQDILKQPLAQSAFKAATDFVGRLQLN